MLKHAIGIACTCLSVVSFNASAALIDNDTYTTDTVSNLDWFDLSFTVNISYNDAIINNPGWRHATNMEIENLFGMMFDGYYDTDTDTGHHSSDSLNGAYADQNMDVDLFISLFGITWTWPDSERDYSYGIYKDEDAILRNMGAFYDPTIPHSRILSTEFIGNYDEAYTEGNDNYGIYLVRDTVVPIPPAIWLFGSGLIGLIGVARRKKNV